MTKDAGQTAEQSPEYALMAVEEGFNVLVVAEDGRTRIVKGLTFGKADRMLEIAWERLERRIRQAHEPDPRVVEDDLGWHVSMVCPDGVERVFTYRRPKQRSRAALSPEVRYAVLKRDNHTCRYCGRKAPDVALHIDHIISVKDGGTDDLANLGAACFDCNVGKGADSA